MIQPDPHILVIFGASGDLTYRKLIPAMFDLFVQKLLHEKTAILGLSHTDLSDEAFRKKLSEGITTFANFGKSEPDKKQALIKFRTFTAGEDGNQNVKSKLSLVIR